MANISVCVPTYNRKDYLLKTIESIVAQSYKDYEIVIVDDGSNDGTPEILELSGYPFNYYYQENRGDAAARNKLIELSKGEYITFLDSDDLLMPDALERMVSVAERESDDVVVYGSYLGIDKNGDITRECKRKLYSGNVTQYLFQDIFIHSCGSLFPKRILEGMSAFDTSLRVCSDYDLWLRLSLQYRFIALPEPTFKRRRHSENLSKESFENRASQYEVLRRFYYEKGGKTVIPRHIAMQRLSKETYKLARCALREGNQGEAKKYLAKSNKLFWNIKTSLWLLIITLRRFLNLK